MTAMINRNGRSFDPRSHAGSDNMLRGVIAKLPMFRSTLPRGERHAVTEGSLPGRDVSIHAPTRGATQRRAAPRCVREVSIHAPTRGATHDLDPDQEQGWFRSTLPRGERPLSNTNREEQACFDPRSHAGSDSDGSFGFGISTLFRSTLPRGERRPETKRSRLQLRGFDPRSHAGSDQCAFGRSCHDQDVSIHAPTRGATAFA